MLETFYLYSKTENVKQVYQKINNYYKYNTNSNIESELKRIAFNNNFSAYFQTDAFR